MNREIFVNVEGKETRVAIKEEGRVSEIHIERGSDEGIVGNIYKGVVTDVLPGMEAAFVDIDIEKNVFLHVSDALSLQRNKKKRRKKGPPRIENLVQKGQEILVQVVKEPIGGKGARVTCALSIPGRYLVLMASAGHIGVSRRITKEKERSRLKSIVGQFKPTKFGIIIRTVAEGTSKDQLHRDFKFLEHQWQKITQDKKKKKGPLLLYKDLDLVQRIVRDIFTRDFQRLILDNLEAYREVIKMTRIIAPHLRKKVELYRGSVPIFYRYDVEEELERALQRRVWLHSGGYLIIDPTEALTSIDVNTGKYVGKSNLDDTVLKINLEAAEEIPRQLKLRDIGGIIVIDFIDMEREKDQVQLMETFERELAKDKTKTSILGLTKLGLVEMTRKKVKQGIGEYLQRECPYCKGTGRVLTPESAALEVIHQLKKRIAEDTFKAVLIEVHPDVGSQLIGPGGKHLKSWEKKLGKEIYVRGNERMHLEEIRFVKTGEIEEVARTATPVQKGEILDIFVQDRHAHNPDDGIGRLEGFVLDIVGGGNRVGRKVKVEIDDVYKTFAKAKIIDKS